MQAQSHPLDWVIKLQPVSMKGESMEPILLTKVPIVLPFPILHVADEGMAQMFQVAANLVQPPCPRNRFNQPIPPIRRQAPNLGNRRNPRSARRLGNRMVDYRMLRWQASSQGEISFADFSGNEHFLESPRRLAIECKDQRPTGPAVETMHRIDMTADLISGHSHRYDPITCPTSVDNHTRRFADDQQIFVAIKNRQLCGNVLQVESLLVKTSIIAIAPKLGTATIQATAGRIAIIFLALIWMPAMVAGATDMPWFDELVREPPLTATAEQDLLRFIADSLLDPSQTISLPSTLRKDRTPRMLFASVSDGKGPARVLRGAGRGAGEASQDLLTQLGQEDEAPRWVKIDLVRAVVRRTQVNPDRMLDLPRSLYGLAFAKDTKLAFLPEELVAHTLVNSDHHLVLRNIGRRPEAILGIEQLVTAFRDRSLDFYRFSTASIFADHKETVALYRGHRRFDLLTPELLLEAATQAGRYLIRAVDAEGKFDYAYRPKTDELKDDYNILRHAGTIYSMAELYEVTGDSDLLRAAERAIGYLARATQPCEIEKQKVTCVVEGGFVKLGGNALAMVALSKYAEVTGKDNRRALIDDLGRWILATQDTSGEFKVHKLAVATGKLAQFTSGYYPGEAALALLRRGGSEPAWLDAAARATRWLIDVRDRGVETQRLNHDHWLLYALNDLHRRRPDPINLRHAERITRAILAKQNLDPTYEDWLGSYYRPPRSTPTATRSEGLSAAYRLQRDFGKPHAAQEVLNGLKRGIRFQLQTQFRPETVLYLQDPQRALGGFRRGLTHYEIRIDYVQHNISALLALRQILLDRRGQ